MTALDLSTQFTAIRDGLGQIVGINGVLGRLSIVRAQLDALGILTPYSSSPTVQKGPAMPAPDGDDETPWSVPDQGQNKNFRHPDDVCAIFASLQALQAVLATPVTYTRHDGTTGTTTPMAAFTKVQV